MSDIRNLQAYLDAIVEGDQLTTDFYEHEKGWVLDAEYLPDQVLAEGGPVIKLSPERLLNILTFKEELHVPSDAVLSIAYIDGVWFPQKVMAGLAEYYGADFFDDQPSDPDNPPTSTGAALPAHTLIEPPEEAVLTEKDFNKYGVVERIILLKPVDSPAYYVRKLLKEEDLIWVGSSWYPDGPFECRWHDDARCIALRVWTDQNNGPRISP